MPRLFDVRAQEARGPLFGFAGLLLLIIAAHTVLETARDALLLTGPGPRALGPVYMAIAIGTVPGAALSAFVGQRFGQRRALLTSLVLAAFGPALLFVLPSNHLAAMATYILSGMLGSIVVPQFWMLVGTVLTVGQGRRLFGLISAAGVVGGVLGPLAASATLMFLPVKGLLLLTSAIFAVALACLGLVQTPERAKEPELPRRAAAVASAPTVRESPFLTRVALVVCLSTATFLALDYLFKSTLARTLPAAQLGRFIAHYYVVLNVLSLVVQLFSGTVIRRLGVLPALVPTPALLLGGAVLAFLAGGALPAVLLVKGVDGSLRYSLHRVTGELMYLPVPPHIRQRTKPFIDGTLSRVTQAVTGASLFALSVAGLAGPRALAATVAVLAAAWLATVVTMRRPYLALLRSAITSGAIDTSDSKEPIDLESAQTLVQCLSSEDPYIVVGAMRALSQRGRTALVSSLVLLHHDAGVLEQALDLFGGSDRSDWFALARRLLDDPRESVRVAAARALARHEQLDLLSLAHDVGWRARGYAAVRLALRDPMTEILHQPPVAALLEETGEQGRVARLGILAAIADAPRTERLSPLLRRIASEARDAGDARERNELLARAVARQKDRLLIPDLVSLLSLREGREVVRTSLVSLGDAALVEVLRTLRDPASPRRLRLHMPKTVARFATRRAAACLLQEVESEHDGLIRYKAIRSLRDLVSAHRIFVDRRRIEQACYADLTAHFRRLALREIVDPPALPPGAATALLVELLDEKAAHALERAFHLLQIAHPRQGVHDAYVACRSGDPQARATGAELIDALLRRGDQQRLRALFRLATDDLARGERVTRARPLELGLVRTLEEALAALVHDDDVILATLARRLAGVASTPIPVRPRALAVVR